MRCRAVVLILFLSFCAGWSASPPEWVTRSNGNARILLDIEARFFPERAGQSGVQGLDDRIIDLSAEALQRQKQAYGEALRTLRQRMAAEKDPLVRQDLEILVNQAQHFIHGHELNEKYYIPYRNVARLVFGGLQALLDDQVAASRRPAALVRMRRYTGLEQGYTPVTIQAEQSTRERLGRPGLLGPSKAEVEKDLGNTKFFLDGIGQLFDKYKIAGYQEPFKKLREQLAEYDAFVRKEVLPVSREDFRLPQEVYDFLLRQYGVDIPRAELASMAHAAFKQIQGELQQVAAQVAKEKGYQETGYRDVIRELKKDQILGEDILPHYRHRIEQIEEIARREHLVTLPSRPARMRLATLAESAQQPAPHMRTPRLIGNTGETGEFILPLNVPSAAPGKGKSTERVDDFTFGSASWTLTAHEARPGHEMQFSAMIERGVSVTRALFAFNSTNVEGWGLYAERIVFPFMPRDGQLISLQHRLMRAARAFLDPELHMGKITREDAFRVLEEDVVLSAPMANQEVERYTFRSPAQATSYFYGFTRLNQLRADIERALGPRFDQQKFHDFILAQGLLPPAMLREAVVAQFVTEPRP